MALGRFSTGKLQCVSVTAIILAVSAAVQWPTVESARILAVLTIPGKSHWNFMSAVLRALTHDGHRVTAFASFADDDRENFTTVDVSGDLPPVSDRDVARLVGKWDDKRRSIGFTAEISKSNCDAIHRNGRMRQVLRKGRRGPAADFDAILVEPLWLDCVSHMASVLDVPLVYVVPYALLTFLERPFLGHVPNPATVSHVLARHAAVPKTFVQRFTNTALLAYTVLALSYYDLWFK